MQKLITNAWNTMIKIKNFHIFNIGIDGQCWQEHPVNIFEWIKVASQWKFYKKL